MYLGVELTHRATLGEGDQSALREAGKKYMEMKIKEGTHCECPTCGHFVKVEEINNG